MERSAVHSVRVLAMAREGTCSVSQSSLQAQSRTPSLFPFLTVTVLPDLIKSLGREIHLKIVRNSIMRYKYFRVPMVVDDRCLMSVELQQYTRAIFNISPCLSQVMNHKTFGE